MTSDKLHLDAPFVQRIDVLEELPLERSETEESAEEMARLRDELNTVKTYMDEYFNTPKCPDYETIQTTLDLYHGLKRVLRTQYNAQFVTNAWMKYYELYSHFELLPEKLDRPLRAFCNAELPGASICALNHYVRTRRDYDLDWHGSSIVLDAGVLATLGGNEGKSAQRAARDVLGDTYGLWAGNREHWLMNRKNDGDATKIANILDWEARLGPTMDLYSHDAGIYVEDDFNSQERSNMKIHLGCAIAGFCTLRPGGMFIAKQYTLFEPITYTLIAIYATMFEQFFITKPLTSRPFNSEIYLVGKGFLGFPAATRKYLFDLLENFAEVSTCRVPDKTRKQLLKAAETLQSTQVAFIKQNVEYYKRYCKHSREMRGIFDPLRDRLLREWLEAFPITRIDNSQHLRSV